MAAVTRLDSAPVVVVDGTRLALDDVAAVARGEALAALPAEPATRRRMDASVALRRRLVARGVPLYGITTGFGDSVRRHIGSAQAAALQDHLVRFMGTGTGAAASLATARATLLIRANTLARGHSGVRVDVVERLLDLLNAGVTPVIPEEGSVGASGDLVPLSYVAAVVTGRGTVHHRGGTRPAAEALAEAGMTPLVLEPKEALALMNGTAFMTAIATLAAVGAQRLAAASDICTALTTEVLTGITGVFHPFLHEVAKPHPGQARSAAAVRRLLAGSQLAVAYEDVVEQAGADDGYREVAVPIQDHYSVRCAPHFTGVLWDVLAWVGDWLEIEINSSNDNPLFDATSGAVLSGGNFAGGHVALAMDALRTALASVADLVDRQLELVVDEKFNRGLTPNLVPALPPGHPEAGLNHGFKGMQISCSSLTAEALSRCMPLTAFSRSTECHNQDKVSMGTTAARYTRDVVTLVEKVVAIHLLALCQAADLRGPARLAPRTRLVHDRVRAQVPRLETDRPMADDIAQVVDLLVSGRLLADLVV